MTPPIKPDHEILTTAPTVKQEKKSVRNKVISEVAQNIVDGLGALWGVAYSLLHKTATHETPAPSLDQIVKSAEDSAAEKIQAVARGHLLRNKTISPSRILSSLKSSLVSLPGEKLDLNKAATLICRKVNTLLADHNNRGKSHLVESLRGSVRLDPKKTKNKEYSSLVLMDLYITISKDGKQVSLQFQPNNPLLLGKGSYSKVFGAEEILVETAPSKSAGDVTYSRKSTGISSVRTEEIKRVSDDEDNIAAAEQGRMREARGNGVHRGSYAALQGAKRSGAAKGVYISEPRSELAPGVLKQRRYLSDLEKMRETRSLLVDSKDRISITDRQLLQCTKDVAVSFKWLNEQSITHRDGKLANINISYGPDDKGAVRPIAHLADFGFAREGFGYDPLAFENNYYVWDPCCAYFNIATPYSEIFATALMLLETVALTAISETTVKDVRKEIAKQVFYSPNLTFDPGRFMPAHLTPIQQRAFIAFCNVCHDSALLAKELEAVPGFPQSITHAHVTTAMDKLKGEGRLKYMMDYLIHLIDQELSL